MTKNTFICTIIILLVLVFVKRTNNKKDEIILEITGVIVSIISSKIYLMRMAWNTMRF